MQRDIESYVAVEDYKRCRRTNCTRVGVANSE